MRYDILYTIRVPGVGLVGVYYDDIRIRGFNTYMTGYDEHSNRIYIVADRVVYQTDRQYDCGWCHIVAYTMHGETVRCSYYESIR